MRTVRISDEVWDEIAERGSFGETVDDVLRRVFQIGKAKDTSQRVQTKIRERYAQQRMSARIESGNLVVEFQNGASNRWPLPPKDDKNRIRVVRNQAVEFASKNGATEGQENAVKKALTEAGYHLTR
jgi:negative regulator of replication initiation